MIVDGLRSLGVENGDQIHVHSSLSSFGYVFGGAETVVDALLEAVGREGTVMMPTFNHHRVEVYDPRETPSVNGVITNAFWRRERARRSLHPSHPYAAIGPKAEWLVSGHEKATTFGAASPMGKFCKSGGDIILLGVGLESATAKHLGELLAGAACFGQRTLPATCIDPETGDTLTVWVDSFRAKKCPVDDPDAVACRLKERGKLPETTIGDAAVRKVGGWAVVQAFREHMSEGWNGHPGCRNCYIEPHPPDYYRERRGSKKRVKKEMNDMLSTLTMGTASARPGEMATGRLMIGELREGTEFGLPVAVINGSQDGPLLYIQAGSDGNELNGLGVVKEVIKNLDPEELSGGILVVSPLNYHGFLRAEGPNPLDNKKMNRTFPGKESGPISGRLSHAVFEHVKKCDLVLDLHQQGTEEAIVEVRVRVGGNHDLYGECMELAKVFGAEHILDEKGPDGQLARSAPDEGIPTIDPELGGCVGWDQEAIAKGVRGVFNVLYYYGLLDGEYELPGAYTVVDGFESVYASRGGLVEYEADLYEKVEEGASLFKVTDPFGTILEQVKAPKEGILWNRRRLPMVATGEKVCSLGLNPRIEEFDRC